MEILNIKLQFYSSFFFFTKKPWYISNRKNKFTAFYCWLWDDFWFNILIFKLIFFWFWKLSWLDLKATTIFLLGFPFFWRMRRKTGIWTTFYIWAQWSIFISFMSCMSCILLHYIITLKMYGKDVLQCAYISNRKIFFWNSNCNYNSLPGLNQAYLIDIVWIA